MKRKINIFKSIIKDIATNEKTLKFILALCAAGLLIALYNVLDLIFIF